MSSSFPSIRDTLHLTLCLWVAPEPVISTQWNISHCWWSRVSIWDNSSDHSHRYSRYSQLHTFYAISLHSATRATAKICGLIVKKITKSVFFSGGLLVMMEQNWWIEGKYFRQTMNEVSDLLVGAAAGLHALLNSLGAENYLEKEIMIMVQNMTHAALTSSDHGTNIVLGSDTDHDPQYTTRAERGISQHLCCTPPDPCELIFEWKTQTKWTAFSQLIHEICFLNNMFLAIGLNSDCHQI